MVTRMVRIAAIGAALAFPTARAQGAMIVNQTFDLNLVVFVPCASGGAGELVDLSGPLHDMFSLTMNGNHLSGFTHDQPQGISGIGESTGDTYQAVGVTENHFSGALRNNQFSDTFVNNFRIIGHGPGNNFQLHENLRLTVDGNGNLTVVHSNFSVTCN